MSKAEILAELARLSPQDRAEIRAYLDHLAHEKSAAAWRENATSSRVAHIRTPRLANPAQSADFTKQVTELPADAAL